MIDSMRIKKTIIRLLPTRLLHIIYQYRYGINKRKIEKEIERLDELGIDESSDNDVIVSLTSYGDRLKDLHITLYSLLMQSLKPRKIVLCLAEEEFPQKEEDLPIQIRNILKWGISIVWCPDIRSYKKLIPTLELFPNMVIVTADDDVYYPTDWLSKLVCGYRSDSSCIYAHNVSEIRLSLDNQILPYREWKITDSGEASYRHLFKGRGGVLYPPGSLYKDVCSRDLFERLAPTADDIWFWAMAVMNNTKIKAVKDRISLLRSVDVYREFGNQKQTLHEINVSGGMNDRQINNIMEYYPEIIDKLKQNDI